MMRRPLLSSSLCLLATTLLACGADDTRRARATLDVLPEQLAFDARQPGGSPQTIELSNNDAAPLVITGWEVRGAPQDTFILDPEPPLEVPGHASRTMTVRFTNTQWRNATIILLSNADNAPRREVPAALLHATDGNTDGNTDGETDGNTDGETDGNTDGETDGNTDGETDGNTDGETDGNTDGETDGNTDGNTDGPLTGECLWTLGSEVDLAVATSVSKLSIAANDDGFTVGWLTDACALKTRKVTANGLVSGAETSVFSETCKRGATTDLAGAASEEGPVFFSMTQTVNTRKLFVTDLRGDIESEELDDGGDFSGLSATASAGGVAALWRQKDEPKEISPSVIRVERFGGTNPLPMTDTKLPTYNTFRHSLLATDTGLAVLWHGDVGGKTPITGALLDDAGVVVPGSQRQVSSGGTKNLKPHLVRATGGLAAGWTQDGSSVVARLKDDLSSVDGDLVLDKSVSSVAVAAVGSRIAVVSLQHLATDPLQKPVKLTINGIDRVSGGSTDPVSIAGATLKFAPYIDIAAGSVGETLLVAYIENGRVKAVPATCE